MNKFSENEYALLRACELLKDLSDKNFEIFINLSQKASYACGEVLLKEGQDSNYLFILLSGTVDLYKSTHTNQCKIGSLSSGQSIGEMRVIKNKPCSLTVVSSSPIVVLCIVLTQLRHLEYNQCYESILDAIINILSYRLANTNRLVVNGLGNKKKRRKYIVPLLVIATATLFVCELSVALYYLFIR